MATVTSFARELNHKRGAYIVIHKQTVSLYHKSCLSVSHRLYQPRTCLQSVWSAPFLIFVHEANLHAGHCWRSKDELISDVLLWTPAYEQAKAGRPARTYIQQLCEDTGRSPEDLPEAMNDREKWREGQGYPCLRHVMMMMIYIYIYICVCVCVCVCVRVCVCVSFVPLRTLIQVKKKRVEHTSRSLINTIIDNYSRHIHLQGLFDIAKIRESRQRKFCSATWKS